MGRERYTFAVDGMSCASCVGRVERVLGALPGGAGATANLARETAEVPAAAPAVAVAAALERAGFAARLATRAFEVEGMSCAACTARIERVLSRLPGVVEARADLVGRTVTVRLLDGAQDDRALAAALAAAGYPAAPRRGPGEDRAAAETRAAGRRAALAGVLTLPLFLAEMGGHLIPAIHHGLHAAVGTQALWTAQAVLAAAVLAGPGRGFFARGVPNLVRGAPDMNALVALGTAAAFLYSAVATFAPQLIPAASRGVYYEAAAVIVTLVLAGRWLEARARGRAGAAIRALLALAPPLARVERGGTPVEVPVAEVRAGDILHLRPGERVAVDGVVLSGASAVDESMLTGEPLPVDKAAGARLAAGTLNGQGALTFRAERVGADTVLAQIVRAVEAAQGARLPVQDMVNRVTAWFVPAVLAAAAATVAGWLAFGDGPRLTQALVAGVSVLVVACPCAMGLAVPVSILAGTGRAARLGVIFRDGAALQRLAGVRSVAFDKTGTLTLGRPAVTDLIPAAGVARDDALRLAAAAERPSEHPLARAIAAAAGEMPLPAAEDFAAEAGFGVRARIEGRAVLVGTARLMAREGVDTAPLAAAAQGLEAAGKAPVFLAADGVALAVLAVADRLRPETPGAVAALGRLGLEVAMLTGDTPAAAAAVAREAGIARLEAGLLPQDKVAALGRLRAAGPVAFVGDGINDAAALAAADAGLAVAGGADVAAEAADAVLLRRPPAAAAAAVALSRAVVANIRQNLVWAFGYNALLIPVAAFGLVSPMLAAGAMALSSLFVLGNALRLQRFRPPAG